MIPGNKNQELEQMAELSWVVLFLVGYVVLMRWVLPRLGVPT